MNYALLLVLLCMLAGCKTIDSSAPTAASTADQGTSDSPEDFLIMVSAKDFHRSSMRPVLFRNVRLGHVPSEGEKQYLLCGEFLPASDGDKAGWIPFTTIKTSGYEQWFGYQASTLCKRPSITWDQSGDLSSALQDELRSLR